MKKNNKQPAFSLMEVMIILLIMAVTLAATAPMISRKMSRNVGTAEEPWKYNGANQSISFNGNGRDNSTVYIGTDRVRYADDVSRPRNNTNMLVINSTQVPARYNGNRSVWRPHIEFGMTGRLRTGANGRYWFLDAQGNKHSYFDMSEDDINTALNGKNGLNGVLNNAQSALDSALQNSNIMQQGARLQALINAQERVDNLSTNVTRGFIGYARTNGNGNLDLPYLSSRVPYTYAGNMRRGIVLGTRLHMHGNIDNRGAGGRRQGVEEDDVDEKIFIGHDLTLHCSVNGTALNMANVIILGSAINLRGNNVIAIGRDLGMEHSFRIRTADSVMINNTLPLQPTNDCAATNDGFEDFIFFNTFRTGGGGGSTVQNVTGIGRRLFANGDNHTLIGDTAHCGRISNSRNDMPLRASDASVAIGRMASAAGSNCVAIGRNLVAGYPQVTTAAMNRNQDGLTVGGQVAARNNTVAIGVSDDHFQDTFNTSRLGGAQTLTLTNMGIPNSLNATAANAVVIGAYASAREARDRTTANHNNPNGGIAIGAGATVTRGNAIAIGSGNVPPALNPVTTGNPTNGSYSVINSIPNSPQAIHDNSVAIGVDAQTSGNNQIMLGSNGQNGRVTAPTVVIPGNLRVRSLQYNNRPISAEELQNAINNLSDIRLKNVGEKLTSGLEDIKKLEFFNYTFKDDKEQKPHVGVMAQDLQKVFPTSVTEGSDGYLRIRWDEMFYAALNAIKELDRKIIALAEDVKSFFERVDSIDLKVAQSQKALDDLKSDFADIDMRLKALEE